MNDPMTRAPTPLDCGGRPLALDRPRIMGILNTTPDSFSDGGQHFEPRAAVEHALRMVEEGADLVDVGGESTRPGAEPVSEQQELDRVIPVIEALTRETQVPISIDTSKPGVMRAAVAAGAGFINDVYALRADGALEMAAELGVPVCLMHMQGEPRTMQSEPSYLDVTAEVAGFLQQRAAACIAAGIPASQVVLDPGFGFGKTLEHNRALFHALPELARLGHPLLVGVSRKSMLGAITGREVDDRVLASATAAALAAARGASILRVHDVAVTVDALKVTAALWPEGDGTE